MALKDYFPDMQEGAFPLADQDWISVEVGEQYLHFPNPACQSESSFCLVWGGSAKSRPRIRNLLGIII